MPFESKAQQRYMFAHKDELGKQGVDVKEWADKTDFKHLPERKRKAPGIGRKRS
jgi:hypothetical protein